jgi:hypothetical protein
MYVILQCIKIEKTKKPLGKSLIFFVFKNNKIILLLKKAYQLNGPQ